MYTRQGKETTTRIDSKQKVINMKRHIYVFPVLVRLFPKLQRYSIFRFLCIQRFDIVNKSSRYSDGIL